MSAIENYFYELDEEKQKIMFFLHEFLQQEFGLNSTIRYKVPFYGFHHWICYISPKSLGIELCFIHGQRLVYGIKFLDPKDRKQISGITITDISLVNIEQLTNIIHEALIIDEENHQLKKTKRNQ